MAGSVNRVILVGNIGKDPEVRSTQEGGKIVNLTLATSETWNDRSSGERKEKTEWHRVVIFNDRVAETVERFVKKGAKLYVEGSLQTRKWTDQQGQEKYSTEIVVGRFNGQVTMLDSQNSSRSSGEAGTESQAPRAASQPTERRPGGGQKGKTYAGDLDDEIPFGPETR